MSDSLEITSSSSFVRLLVFAPALWLSTMESRELRALLHAPSDMGSEDEQRKR